MLKNIPKELRELNQWVRATKSDIKDKDKLPINPNNGKMADPVKSCTWGSFSQAKLFLTKAIPHVGFVLSQDDPYTIIDLDDPYKPEKDWDEEYRAKLAALNKKIMDTFQSYTEISQSGKGVHIIVKGTIPKGVNRDTVELYSSQRYMITTGNVAKDLPILECQELLDILYNEMKPASESVPLEEVEMTSEDSEIIEMAMNASNGDKFTELCNSIPDGVQNSEQDLALLSIIAFYSESNEQCRRIFRMTGRGKREKVIKNDKYLNYTLQKIRANAVPKVDFSELQNRMKDMITNSMAVPAEKLGETERTTAQELHCKPVGNLTAFMNKGPKGDPIKWSEPEPEPKAKKKVPSDDDSDGLVFPPGLVGEVAEYIYKSAAMPVKEMGLMGALGFIAGIIGRQYNVSGVGLNQYLVLLANTGTGKEGMADGIGRLSNHIRQHIPIIDTFMGPSAFASGPALVKTISENPCFLSILGEFGLTLQQLCDPRANGAQVTLRRAYLDLYQKSGQNGVLNASVYSDKEKNTDLVNSPSLTILGESTPETFYEGLSEHHISDGLIPRFTVVEYTGLRPYLNENMHFAPSDKLVNDLVELLHCSIDMQMNNAHVDVVFSSDVKEKAKHYAMEITDRINASSNTVQRQLWSRADLKIKKLAALIAVGVNFHNPMITMAIYNWAKKIVETDIANMMKRFEKGDIGHGESKQYADLKRKLKSYFNGKASVEYKAYHAAGVIPIKYLRRSLNQINSFKKDQRGVGNAIKAVLAEAVECGELVEVAAPQAKKQFNTTSKLYGIGDSFDKGE